MLFKLTIDKRLKWREPDALEHPRPQKSSITISYRATPHTTHHDHHIA
jgi:hypothetical protein